MSKKLAAIVLAVALIGTGCANKTDSTAPAEPSKETDTVTIEKQEGEAAEQMVLETAIELLGVSHEDSANYFDGGEEIYSVDDNYLIGRKYAVTAFDVDTTLYASLNTENIINSIGIHLGEDNFDTMKAKIVEVLGEPTEVNDTPSEGGSTSVMWALGDKLIYLYNGYEVVDLQLILKDIPVSKIDEQATADFPETVRPILAEEAPYPLLRDFIIETFEIPEDYYAKTKYYYNYVDLNNDGHNEVFALVMGPYTSGTGGSSALIAYEFEGEMRLLDTMSLIHSPIIVSDEMSKGMKDLIVLKRGGGADAAYVKLIGSEGQYQSVNDGEVLKSLDGVSGRAIIANDILNDIDHNAFLTLE